MKKIIKILVEVLIFCLKLIVWLKNAIFFLLNRILVKPLKLLLYWPAITVYRWWWLFLKKINWRSGHKKHSLNSLILSKRLVHAFIAILAIWLVYTNLKDQTSHYYSPDQLVGQTSLAQLIPNNSGDNGEIIEEFALTNPAGAPTAFSYLNKNTFVHGQATVMANPEAAYVAAELNSVPNAPTNQAPIKRTAVIRYVVRRGDTISGIAGAFGLTMNTILWANNLKLTSPLKPGQQLTILPASGVLHKVARGQTLGKIAALYSVNADQIAMTNGLDVNQRLSAGRQLIIPGGTPLPTASAPTQVAGNWRRQPTGNQSAFTNVKGPSVAATGEGFLWPNACHVITQYFSWRHSGVDIACPFGSPIHAAADGVVEKAGWNTGGYGNMILIDHAGGYKTRYGHLSQIAVQVGETVSQGEYIGAEGSTGHSTGPHLHFEVIINGAVYNPLNYIR